MNEQDRLTYLERLMSEMRTEQSAALSELKVRAEQSESDHRNLAEQLVDGLGEVKKEVKNVDERLITFEKEHATIKGEITMLKWVGSGVVGLAVILQPIISWIRGK